MQAPPLPYCYKCDGSSTSQCSRCGRVFCAAHGGERLASQSSVYSRLTVVSARVLCDECTPNQALLRLRLGVVIAIALVAGTLVAIMTFNLRR